MNRARKAVICAPCSSENKPATHAAAISLTLWPRTAEGCTPHDFQSSANPTCIAKMAGCAISVRCNCEVSSERPSSSRSEKVATPRSAASHCSITWRKTGSCCISSRPMPHHCGPCPLIIKATRGAPSGRGVNEVRTFTLSSLIANASSSSMSSGTERATRVSRCG